MGGFGQGAGLVSADNFGDSDVGAFLHPAGQVVGIIGIFGNPLYDGRSPKYQAVQASSFFLLLMESCSLPEALPAETK